MNRLHCEHFTYLVLCGLFFFFNENVEIPQMVLLVLVIFTEYELTLEICDQLDLVVG